jgi:hypothetical protein
MASATTSIKGLKFAKNEAYSVSEKPVHHSATGSPFDSTKTSHYDSVVEHESYLDFPVDTTVFSSHIETKRKSPKSGESGLEVGRLHRLAIRCADFSIKGCGKGGTVRRGVASSAASRSDGTIPGDRLKATSVRHNPPSSYFRRLFERGDLPIKVEHSSKGIRVAWYKTIDSLDLHHVLPVFVSGLREREEPFASLAYHGTLDLLSGGGDRVLTVVPQLIQPLREALNTRDKTVMRQTLLVLQRLSTCGAMVGEALVPFFRQLLPVLNVFKSMRSECAADHDWTMHA